MPFLWEEDRLRLLETLPSIDMLRFPYHSVIWRLNSSPLSHTAFSEIRSEEYADWGINVFSNILFSEELSDRDFQTLFHAP